MPGTKNWVFSCEGPLSEKRKNNFDLCSLNCTTNCSQLSASSTKSQTLTPTSIYERQMQKGNSLAICTLHTCTGTKTSDCSHSDSDQVLNVCCDNDYYSSSKSNSGLLEDSGECSPSDALIAEKIPEGMSEKDICISILINQGPLDRVWNGRDLVSAENPGNITKNYCSKSCKVCDHLESTLNLLICDNCEDAFHISCCNPHVKRIPDDEWLCNSCLKKKHISLKEKSNNILVNISTEIGRNGNSALEGELGSMEFMFRGNEPYMSSVRIGDEFQANVPDWSGPIPDDECEIILDPLEMHPFNNVHMQEWNKPVKLSSMGNWLQCRETIEGVGQGVDGVICGKWRRAPLFEVQTDDWECFCCILWDPDHADCAVPQELDTEEVMKQLKYIEMLRPRLDAKRRKLDC